MKLKNKWEQGKDNLLCDRRAAGLLFEKIVGCRFLSYVDMESWFRKKMDAELPGLVITACPGINQEISEGITDTDYATDCTFGENRFGTDSDFTIEYIMDNAGMMFVTSAGWN